MFKYHFFPTNSNTAAHIAFTPVFRVGSATGAQNGEWSDGSGLPLFLLSATASGFAPPTQKIRMGTLSSVRPYRPKSSPPITGCALTTFSAPNQLPHTFAI